MTLSQRIAAINLANTYGELRDAMDGFWDEAVAEHREIVTCVPLRNSVTNGMFDHALIALADLASSSAGRYPDLHDVLSAAAQRSAHIQGASAPGTGD